MTFGAIYTKQCTSCCCCLSMSGRWISIWISSFFNGDSLHARLNINKVWSYKEKMHKKIKAYMKSLQKEPTNNRCLLILDLAPFRFRHLSKQFYWCPFLNKDWAFLNVVKCRWHVSRYCKLYCRLKAKPWWEFMG